MSDLFYLWGNFEFALPVVFNTGSFMSVSQQQIANALNLSIITVSRALRDHPDLAEATKARVLEKAHELGYAKSKKRQASQRPVLRRAGIFLYENLHGERQDTLASGVKRAIFMALQKECQRLQVETTIETPVADEMPLSVKNGTIDVAFIFGRYSANAVARLKNIPAIAVSSFIDHPGLPRIVADNLNGMRLATEHLIGLGHRDILFVSMVDTHTRLFEERADGYVAAMHRNGLAPAMRFCEDADDLPLAAEVARYTAVVVSSDSVGYQLHAKLKASGVRVPEDCSMVGFDNLPTDYPYLLDTYTPDWELMGRMAADLLLSQPLNLQGQGLVITVPGKMLVRGSAASLPEAPARPVS
ncbi:MAG: LacI family DNA-binding transcriptional regulator [Opitutaceae bacterium]